MNENISISVTKPSKDYELIDSGLGEKLERFGTVVLSRPDPQALWPRRLPQSEWANAQGKFVRSADEGKWLMKQDEKDTEKSWPINLAGLTFLIKPTAFKHVGLFPEQSSNWQWTKNLIQKSLPKVSTTEDPQTFDVLNLFGYTGGASLACASAGAHVVHVDSSKSAMAWARQNAELSALADKPIRWILDDARAFVTRELKRGKRYNGVIMDPPAFGHGPDSELWKIEDHFLALLGDCFNLLKTDGPRFILINGYSAGYSSIAYRNNLLALKERLGGALEIGELAIEEAGDANTSTARLLPAGIFARWTNI